MSIITPITGGAGVVPLGALARGHHTVRSRALAGEAGEFAGGWAETDLYLPEWVRPDATLDLDFLGWQSYSEPAGLGRGGVISTPDAALTVSRPGPRGRTGPTGLRETIGSGLIDRDFTAAGVARGLQIEPQATNLATYGDQFNNAAWQKFASSISPNATTGPDGTAIADKFIAAASTAVHYLARGFTITAGQIHTETIYAKAAELTHLQVVLDTGSGVGAFANFDLAAGTITASQQMSTATGAVFAIDDAGSGWWRLRVTSTAGAVSTTLRVAIVLITSGSATFAQSFAGDGVSGVYIEGAQLEATAYPTSYTPAEASSAVRYADFVTIPAGGSWFNAAASTILLDIDPTYVAGAVYLGLPGAANSFDDTIYLWANSAGTMSLVVRSAGVSYAALPLAVTFGAPLKAAISWSSSGARIVTTGQAVALDASVTLPDLTGEIRLGRNGWGTAGPTAPQHHRRLTYWPHDNFDDAALEALVA